MQKYEIEIKTGDDLGAGTDSKVKLSMYGSDRTVDIELDRKDTISNNKDLYERGQVDSFLIINKPLGVMNKISINNESKGLGSDWQLEYVKVSFEDKNHK
jgi:hypothetical protein